MLTLMTCVRTVDVDSFYCNLLVKSKLGIHFVESINKQVKLKMVKIFINVQSNRQLVGEY